LAGLIASLPATQRAELLRRLAGGGSGVSPHFEHAETYPQNPQNSLIQGERNVKPYFEHARSAPQNPQNSLIRGMFGK
jgi:hypothetical protein